MKGCVVCGTLTRREVHIAVLMDLPLSTLPADLVSFVPIPSGVLSFPCCQTLCCQTAAYLLYHRLPTLEEGTHESPRAN